MASVVRVQDIIDEIDSVSEEHHAYLNRQTGELVTIGDEEICALEEERDLSNYPDWQQEAIRKAEQVLASDDYLALPSKLDIHEYSIIKQFCYQVDNVELGKELLFQIRGSGGFQRFKHAIRRYGIEDKWHRYRGKALEKIAINFLKENSIPYL
jgi:Uncharacterised protein family (UPF0158)